MTVPVLPNELVNLILSFCPIPEPAFLDQDSRADPTNPSSTRRTILLSCSLVCRSFRGWAQAQLFSSVLLEEISDEERFLQCMEGLGDRGVELLGLVKRVKLGTMNTTGRRARAARGKILRSCGNIEELWCSRISLELAELNCGTNLRRIRFHVVQLSGSCPLSLPKLECLVMGDSLRVHCGADNQSFPFAKLPSLRALVFKPYVAKWIGNTATYENFPFPAFGLLAALALDEGCQIDNDYFRSHEQLFVLDVPLKRFSGVFPLAEQIVILPPNLRALRLRCTGLGTDHTVGQHLADRDLPRLRSLINNSLAGRYLQELIVDRHLFRFAPEAWKSLEGVAVKKLTVAESRREPMDMDLEGLAERFW